MTKKIKNAPGWLGLSEDRSAFVYLHDRADIVRQIFELSIAGLGGYTIAKLLNSKSAPAFGTSKKWDQSTIRNILSSRATIGEYQRKQTIEGKEVLIGYPVPGYYPAVIEERLFQAAQNARQENLSSGRGRKGKLITNLFSGLTTCFYCGSPVKFHSNGQAKSLICQRVREGRGCHRFGWSYGNFENSFLDFLRKDEVVDHQLPAELDRLQNGITAQSQLEIYHARAKILQLLRASRLKLTIVSAGLTPPRTEPDAHIRRDHPDRYFTAILAGGSFKNGYPIAPPKPKLSQKFNANDLAQHLGVSPRQGDLTALLAEGESLTLAAKQLGMTLATARWHLRKIFEKTNAHSQVELVKLAEQFKQE